MLETVRGCLGALDLVAAPRVAAAELGSHAGRGETVVMRVLGVRQVAQALLVGRTDSRTAHRFGAAVDAAHCASMVLLALLDRRHRRAALVQASLAALLGAAELGRA